MDKYEKILFVNPILCQDKIGNSGIAYLRGYLESKQIPSDYLNINDLVINNSQDRKLLREFYFNVRPIIEKGVNADKFSLKILNHFCVHTLWQGEEAIWSLLYNIRYIEGLFDKYYKNISFYDIVGFSITTRPQLLFSLMSSLYIKEKISKDIKIVFGGTRVNSSIHDLIKLLSTRPFVDYFVVGEGESAVYDLATGREGVNTPGLVYLDKDGNYAYSDSDKCFKIDDYQSPLYNDDDFPVVRGSNSTCYWRKCSFCGSFAKNSKQEKYTPRQIDDIIKDIRTISNNIRTKDVLFHFSDSAMPPDLLDRLSQEIVRHKNLPKRYRVNMRFEPQIDKDFLIRIKKAGFGNGTGLGMNEGMIVFGWETVTPRLQKLMKRGVGNE